MSWPAYVVTRENGSVSASLQSMDDRDLPEGEVLVDVEWSSVNYKDAMVTQPGNRVARTSPLVPGVDLAGVVAASEDQAIRQGTRVLVHGYGLGVERHGGYAARARVPARWVVPLPPTLSTRHAAGIGTAGYTAVLSLEALARAGVHPDSGPVLVTGASGGVGSMAVAALARRGYEVHASTGKVSQHDYLRSLGARDVLGRELEESPATPGKPSVPRVLGSEQWSGAVDCVGGETLAAVLRSLRYGGAVAASGLTAGAELHTTVYPFIVRGVSLLGVDSVQVPIEERRRTWSQITSVLPGPVIDSMISHEVDLTELDPVLADVLAARVRGRVLVRPTAGSVRGA